MIQNFSCKNCGNPNIKVVAWLYNRKRFIIKCDQCAAYTDYTLTSNSNLYFLTFGILVLLIAPIILATINIYLFIVYGIVVAIYIVILYIRVILNKNIHPNYCYHIQVIEEVPNDPYLYTRSSTLWQKLAIYKPLILVFIAIQILAIIFVLLRNIL